jgi:hypothetical protein|tara:strand:- start:956 stop:1291 length:336 start_codon:yes stop_codon:yes gene_type:complete
MKGALTIIILSIVIFTACSSTGQHDELAQCLADNGVRMYGTYWCPHCQEQKADFGKSWRLVPYVECATSDGGQTRICEDEGIEGYPTWVFPDGTRQSGKLSFETLRNLGGC